MNRPVLKAVYAGSAVLVFVVGLVFSVAWVLRYHGVPFHPVTLLLFALSLCGLVFANVTMFIYTRNLLDETLKPSSGQGELDSMQKELREVSGLTRIECDFLTWCRGDHTKDADSWLIAYYLPRSDVTVFLVRKPGQS